MQREFELVAAVAAQRVEDVAGEALGVHAHQYVLAAVDLALDERDVRLAGQRLAEGNCGELAVRGREPHLRDALDELLRPASVLDQIGDRQQLDPVLLAE
jgi:hypothetical protein